MYNNLTTSAYCVFAVSCDGNDDEIEDGLQDYVITCREDGARALFLSIIIAIVAAY